MKNAPHPIKRFSVIVALFAMVAFISPLKAQTGSQPGDQSGMQTEDKPETTSGKRPGVKADEQPLLVKAELITHTNDDDKKHDTGIFVEVKSSDESTVIATCANADNSGDDATLYSEGSDHTVRLVIVATSINKSACQGFKVHMWQHTSSTDTWLFKPQVVLTFSDGSTLRAEGGSTELKNDQASADFNASAPMTNASMGEQSKDQPILVNAKLITHTNDDGKDHDTGIFVIVKTSDGSAVIAKCSNADNSADDGTKYQSESDHTVNLEIVSTSMKKSACRGFNVHMWQHTNGRDTWLFKPSVLLTFSDGSTLVAEGSNTKLKNDKASTDFRAQSSAK